MADCFNINRQSHAMNEVSTPSGVQISIDGELRLAQRVGIQYTRQVNPIYELGSEDVWMSAQPPTGTIDMERVVGTAGVIWQKFKPQDPCKGVTIQIKKGKGCGADPGVLIATDCISTELGFTAQAGEFKITDTGKWMTGCIKDKA